MEKTLFTPPSPAATSESSGRLLSLDALRGFDMFFITGGAALIVALCKAFGCPGCWLAQQMDHVPWAGLAHHDTIFPLFLFLAGASWPFSLASQQARGRSTRAIYGKVAIRMLAFFAIELMLSGILRLRPDFRLMGVLSFIGFSWGVAAILFMQVKSFSRRIALIAGLLVGYWVLLRFFVAPGAPAGADTFSKEWNIVSWLDRTIWPNLLYKKGVYEPESLFSLPGGVALALCGMCAGAWLRSGSSTPARKAGLLAVAAAVLLALDLVFVFLMGTPIVKALWTPSFVLAAAAYSAGLLSLFYWIIDVRGWRRWTLYFRVIGMNSILIYLMMRLGILSSLGRFLSEGFASKAGAPWSGVVSAVGLLVAGWGVLYVMYRKKAFFKI